MDTRLRKLADNYAKIDLQKIILEEIKRDEAFLIRLNLSQLQASKRADGKALGKYKSKSYAAKKGRDTIDLLLSGEFYKGWFVEVDKTKILFGSKDSKSDFLTKRYGESIFGLTKENISFYSKDILWPRVEDRIRKILHL